jgi:penicillin-binding protein 2
VVFPEQPPADYRKALQDSFPGSGEASFPIDPENWMIITDGMAEVTQPGAFHTAGSAHLEGIDFAGKTGTAEVVGHDAAGHTAKGHAFVPNVWFVGVTPRRNPELVVAVLWQNGEFSYYSARIAAQIVSAYVDKQRRLQHNLPPLKAQLPAATEVGAVWATPSSGGKHSARKGETAGLHTGHFFVSQGRIVAPSETLEARARDEKAPSFPKPFRASATGGAMVARLKPPSKEEQP